MKRSTNLNRGHTARLTPNTATDLMQAVGMSDLEIRAAHAHSLAVRPSFDLQARIIARWGTVRLTDALAARGWRHEPGRHGRQRVIDGDGALLGEFDAREAWIFLLLTEPRS